MTVASRHARVASHVVRVHGETVTLAGGSTVQGVFDLFGPRADGDSETGRSMRISQQHNPTLALRDADASTLAEGDTLTIRGDDWRIARLDPDGYGLTMISLYPAQDQGPADHGKVRWDWPLYERLSATVKGVAKRLNVPLTWGGGWMTIGYRGRAGKRGPTLEEACDELCPGVVRTLMGELPEMVSTAVQALTEAE